MPARSSGAGVTKHTDLTDKEVAGVIDHAAKSITTAKGSPGFVTSSLIGDGQITHAKLYDYALDTAYIDRMLREKYIITRFDASAGGYDFNIVTENTDYTDKAFEYYADGWWLMAIGRYSDVNNYVRMWSDTGYATADFRLNKKEGGVWGTVAAEAIDMGDGVGYLVKLSCLGTAAKAFREDMTTARLSITTTLTVGKFGVGMRCIRFHLGLAAKLRTATSPCLRPVAYFEMPLIETGNKEEPYKIDLPQQIVDSGRMYIDKNLVPQPKKYNLLSVSNSPFIKIGKDGKPTEYIAIVRIIEQPDRASYLRPISDALAEIRANPKNKELTKEEAIKRAKALDDKLVDFDLIQYKKTQITKKMIKDYIDWRWTTYGVECDEEIAQKVLEDDKGWG